MRHGEELSLVLKVVPCDIAAITKSSDKTQTEEQHPEAFIWFLRVTLKRTKQTHKKQGAD